MRFDPETLRVSWKDFLFTEEKLDDLLNNLNALIGRHTYDIELMRIVTYSDIQTVLKLFC